MILVLSGRSARFDGVVRGLEAAGLEAKADAEVDLASMPAVRDSVKACLPSAVVLAADWSDIEACEADEGQAFARNAEAAINVAAAALEFGCVPVLISSAEIFAQSGGPWSEADTPEVISTFARSKLQGETFIMRVAKNALVLRVGPVLGDGLHEFVDQLTTPSTFADDEYVSPVGACDLGTALAALLTKEVRGVVHVANSGPVVSRAALWSQVAQALGRPASLVVARSGRTLDRNAVWARSATLHIDRLNKVADGPVRNWRDALVDAADQGAVRTPGPAEQAGPTQISTPSVQTRGFGSQIEVAELDAHVVEVLHIEAGKQVGLRMFGKQGRRTHVVTGKVLLEVLGPGPEEDHILKSGTSALIPAGARHQITAVGAAQLIFIRGAGDDDSEWL